MGRRDLGSEAWAREKAAQRARRAGRDKAAHAAEERARYRAKRASGWRPAPTRSRSASRTPPAPVPAWDDHELYRGATIWPVERRAIAAAFDSGQRDLLQEWALALLEGRDPKEAVRCERSSRAVDRLVLVFGTDTVTGLTR